MRSTILTIALLILMRSQHLIAETNSPTVWPTLTAENRPWTRWWWPGNAVDRQNLTDLLTQYRDAGIGGVEICPIYGAKGYEDQYLQFLSPQWMQMLAHTTGEARRLGIQVDLTTGTGWPFGGPNVSAETASASVVLQQYEVAGATKFDQKLPDGKLQHLLAVAGAGEKVDLTDRVKDGQLDWTAPPGYWKIYALSVKQPVQKVKRAAPGGEGNVLDPYSVVAMSNYLARFDAAFKGIQFDKPRAHFHDSFEYYGANWTNDFFDQFHKLRGYNLGDHLPAMFGEGDADTIARVKSDYRQTIAELHLEYIQRWHEWAHSHGGLSRNQAHGAPGNLLDLYAASDIPETEIFGPLDERDYARIKFASSAVHITGRKLASAESFTWLGEHFQLPLAEVKPAVDFLFLSGINHIFFHGVPYSPRNVEWPGWLFYASVHFGPHGGLWHDLPAFNDYVARCQSVLQSGESDNDLLLYFPIHDIWHNSAETLLPLGVHNQNKWLWGSAFHDTAETLRKHGYTYDIVSDAILMNAKVEYRAILLGGHRYEALIIPPTRFMQPQTLEQIIALVKRGANVIVQNAVPSDVPGFADLENRRAKMKALELTALDVTDNLIDDLKPRIQFREMMVDKGIQFVRRRHDRGSDYFVVNKSDKPISDWIPLARTATSVVILDPHFENRAGKAATRGGYGYTFVYLQMQPGESRIIRTFNPNTDVNGAPWAYEQPAGEAITLSGGWKIEFAEGGPVLPAATQTEKLQSWTTLDDPQAKRFAGTARYRLEFNHRPGNGAQWLLDLGKVCESARVRMNGADVGTLWCAPFQIRVGEYLKPGKNELEIEVTNLAANRIADADRRGVNWKSFHEINFVNKDYKPFDASDWPPRASGLLGPVKLTALEALDPSGNDHK